MEDLTLIGSQWEGRLSVDGELITAIHGTEVGDGIKWVIHCKVTDCYMLLSAAEKNTLFGE